MAFLNEQEPNVLALVVNGVAYFGAWASIISLTRSVVLHFHDQLVMQRVLRGLLWVEVLLFLAISAWLAISQPVAVSQLMPVWILSLVLAAVLAGYLMRRRQVNRRLASLVRSVKRRWSFFGFVVAVLAGVYWLTLHATADQRLAWGATLLSAFMLSFIRSRVLEKHRWEDRRLAQDALNDLLESCYTARCQNLIELKDHVARALGALRELVLACHGATDDPSLCVSLHKYNAQEFSFETAIIQAFPDLKQTAERVKTHEESRVLAVRRENGKDSGRIVYGSLCGYSILDEFSWRKRLGRNGFGSTERWPTVVENPDRFTCQALDDSYLHEIPDVEEQEKLLVGSYLRSVLTIADEPPVPDLFGGWLYPVLICHARPGFFTSQDILITETALGAIQAMLERNREYLSKGRRIPGGVLSLLKQLIGKPADGFDLGREFKETRGRARQACSSATLGATQDVLRACTESAPHPWPLFTCRDRRVGQTSATLIAHEAVDGRPILDLLEAAPDDNVRALADVLLLTSAARFGLENRDGEVFVRTEWASWASDHLHEALSTYEPGDKRRLVLVVGARGRDAATARDAEEFERIQRVSREWKVCLEIQDLDDVRLARDLEVAYVCSRPDDFDDTRTKASLQSLLAMFEPLDGTKTIPLIQGLTEQRAAESVAQMSTSPLLLSGPGLGPTA